MTVSPIPRRRTQTVEFPLGASPAVRTDGGCEATLVMTPGEAPRVRLTQLAWGVGVGWYAQQSLELDLADARRVAALLERAPRSAAQVSEIETVVAGSLPPEREPIDLATARARRSSRRRSRTTGRAGRVEGAPKTIARRHEAVTAREESADR